MLFGYGIVESAVNLCSFISGIDNCGSFDIKLFFFLINGVLLILDDALVSYLEFDAPCFTLGSNGSGDICIGYLISRALLLHEHALNRSINDLILTLLF